YAAGAGTSLTPHLPSPSVQRGVATRLLNPPPPAKLNIHHHTVVTAAFNRYHNGFAGLGKIDPVPKLAKNCVHHYAAIGIVFRTKDRQRSGRSRRPVVPLRSCCRFERVDEHTQTERRTVALFTGNAKVATHPFGKTFA